MVSPSILIKAEKSLLYSVLTYLHYNENGGFILNLQVY